MTRWLVASPLVSLALAAAPAGAGNLTAAQHGANLTVTGHGGAAIATFTSIDLGGGTNIGP